MLVWMGQGMTIEYILELVVKAKGEEGITLDLLPPIQLVSAENLFIVLLEAKYTVMDADLNLKGMEEDKLLDLANRVGQDVIDGKYLWVSTEQQEE